MPSELAFHAVKDARPVSTQELYQQLFDALETTGSLDEAAGKLVLDEVGIVVSLIFDERAFVRAVAEISHDAQLKHISRLSQVFRDMGWVIGGA